MPEYADFAPHPVKDELIQIFVKKEFAVFIRRIERLCQFRREKSFSVFVEELRIAKVEQRQIGGAFRQTG